LRWPFGLAHLARLEGLDHAVLGRHAADPFVALDAHSDPRSGICYDFDSYSRISNIERQGHQFLPVKSRSFFNQAVVAEHDHGEQQFVQVGRPRGAPRQQWRGLRGSAPGKSASQPGCKLPTSPSSPIARAPHPLCAATTAAGARGSDPVVACPSRPTVIRREHRAKRR
jgi:hypothetical protein